MADGGVNSGRRRLLTAATTVVGGLGVVAVAWPFLASMKPSARAQAAGAPVEVDIGMVEPGQLIRVEWRGKPVWIVRRTEAMLASLEGMGDKLRDPASEIQSQTPHFARNEYRSIKEEFLVLVGICTHLGCSPTYRPEVAPPDLGPDWKGGSSAHVTVRGSIYPVGSIRTCPHPLIWKCRPIATSVNLGCLSERRRIQPDVKNANKPIGLGGCQVSSH